MKDASSSSAAKKIGSRVVSDSYLSLIHILRTMGKEFNSGHKVMQIDDIVERSGHPDEKEVQRYLYILEGQKMVSPKPEGDFTSKMWYITKDGLKALQVIDNSVK